MGGMRDQLTAADWKVLRVLTADGRATWAELGAALGVTPPAAAERVRRLEERGVICGYTAVLDAGAVGCRLTAFASVTLDRQKFRGAFLKWVHKQAEIAECHHVTGEDEFLLKLRCRDASDLARLLQQLKDQDGVSRARTMVVLSTEKESTHPPLPKSAEGK